MGEARADTGYNNPPRSHNQPSGEEQTSPSYRRRIRHDLHRDSVPLPDHLTRIEFVMGEHRGCPYVYDGKIAAQLIQEKKATLSINQMESTPAFVKEVREMIAAARR